MKKHLFGLLFAFLATSVFAHPEGHCLAVLAQQATQLKTCLLKQSEEGECDNHQAELDAQIRRCDREQFTAEAVAEAKVYGEAQIDGNVWDSPYQQQVRQNNREKMLIQPNVDRFLATFPQFEAEVSALSEPFNTSRCPDQYEGREGRYLQVLTVFRERLQWPLGDELTTQAQPVMFFSATAEKVCYSAEVTAPNSLSYQVANIPETVVRGVAREPGVTAVVCEITSCNRSWVKFQQKYREYQAQAKAYEVISACISRGWLNNRLMSAGADEARCPDGDLETKRQNIEGHLKQLDNLLFQPLTLRFQAAKSK